ncbi:MAG TPA: hypothetical protein VLI90_00575 [Tepidisphaeraceae bacterium]|nr:hypothetical protein [Tepidisphaeraceae bacterium]
MRDPSTTTAKWLGVIVVLQVVTLAGQWAGVSIGAATPAHAQLPDAGAQRNDMIAELKGVNERLDRLTAVLSSGNLQVKVAKSDDNKAR